MTAAYQNQNSNSNSMMLPSVMANSSSMPNLGNNSPMKNQPAYSYQNQNSPQAAGLGLDKIGG